MAFLFHVNSPYPYPTPKWLEDTGSVKHVTYMYIEGIS